jgi:hypothetical protein
MTLLITTTSSSSQQNTKHNKRIEIRRLILASVLLPGVKLVVIVQRIMKEIHTEIRRSRIKKKPFDPTNERRTAGRWRVRCLLLEVASHVACNFRIATFMFSGTSRCNIVKLPIFRLSLFALFVGFQLKTWFS